VTHEQNRSQLLFATFRVYNQMIPEK
jgi:hypothetical protein